MIAQRKSGRTIRRLAAVLLAASVFVVARTADRASAQGAVKSVHGDWQIRCDTPPGAQGEQCALMQSVTAEDRPNIGLTVIVLKTSDQKSRLMRVVAPLGVLLPSGLGLKIDNQDVGRAGFVRWLDLYPPRQLRTLAACASAIKWISSTRKLWRSRSSR